MTVGDPIEGYTDDRAKLKAEWDKIDGMTQKLVVSLYSCDKSLMLFV